MACQSTCDENKVGIFYSTSIFEVWMPFKKKILDWPSFTFIKSDLKNFKKQEDVNIWQIIEWVR